MPAPDPPRSSGPPWTILVPLGLALFVVGVVAIALLSHDAVADRARAARLIANWSGDRASLESAQRSLRFAIVTRPFDGRAWALASRLTRVSGDPGDGEWAPQVLALSHKLARGAIARSPRRPEGHVAEGWTYLCAHNAERAAAEAERARALAPDDPDVLELLAALARADHRNAEALADLRDALASPAADSISRSSAFARLAALDADLTDDAGADSCWRAALALAPGAMRLREGRVRFLLASRRADDAVAAAEDAVALADNAVSRALRAAAYGARGLASLDERHDADAALADFRRADDDQPDDPATSFNLAYCRVELWRAHPDAAHRRDAEAALDRAQRLAPDDADVKTLRQRLADAGSTP